MRIRLKILSLCFLLNCIKMMEEQHPALGIDYGDARIGIAATDALGIMAHPVESIHRQKVDPIARIVELVRQRGILMLVMGMPFRIDGTRGSAAEKVSLFGDALHQALPHLPLVYVDESFTTVVAQEKLHQAGKRAKSHRPIIDQQAAVEILNTWMQGLE